MMTKNEKIAILCAAAVTGLIFYLYHQQNKKEQDVPADTKPKMPIIGVQDSAVINPDSMEEAVQSKSFDAMDKSAEKTTEEHKEPPPPPPPPAPDQVEELVDKLELDKVLPLQDRESQRTALKKALVFLAKRGTDVTELVDMGYPSAIIIVMAKNAGCRI